MKKLIFIPVLLLIFNCSTKSEDKSQDAQKPKKTENKELQVSFYGDTINYESPKSAEAVLNQLKKLESKDTLNITFQSKTTGVCKKKGCWMTLDMPESQDIKVTFKDYGFFVPKDLDDQKVIVKGKGFLKEVSVDEQQHYAKDAGKSEKEIAAIDTPKKEYRFIATGVAIPE